MSNKLKDVFSDKMFEMGGNLSFRDKEAYDKFLESLKSVYDEGRAVEVDGVSAVSTSVKDGAMMYPLMVESTPVRFMVGPSVEPVSITVDTACGERTANFRRYETNNDVIVESNSNEIVFLKFAFRKGGHQVQFTYRMQSQFADKARDLMESYCVAIGILNHLFKPDNEQDISDDLDSLHTIKQSFQITYLFWKKLSLIEDELALSFDPVKIGNIDDNVRDVEELYLLLVEKKAVRVDAKLTTTELFGITLETSKDLPEIGQTIGLTFTDKITYLICEQAIVVYTANLVPNAIIKEYSETETGTIKILYDDTDSSPMYISRTGHKTPYEAEIENSLIMKDTEHTLKYHDALTVKEYYRQETRTD